MLGGRRTYVTPNLHCVLGCKTPAASQRQTIPVELLIALPAQTFIKLLGRIIVDRRLQGRSEEHTSELQSLRHLVCRPLLRKQVHTTERQESRHLVLPQLHPPQHPRST